MISRFHAIYWLDHSASYEFMKCQRTVRIPMIMKIYCLAHHPNSKFERLNISKSKGLANLWPQNFPFSRNLIVAVICSNITSQEVDQRRCWSSSGLGSDVHFLSFLVFFQNKRDSKCCWVDTLLSKNIKLWSFSIKFDELIYINVNNTFTIKRSNDPLASQPSCLIENWVACIIAEPCMPL